MSPIELIALYRAMVLTRTFDAKAIALQRTGRLGTYASSLGQEAVAVGVAAAMRPDDVLLPSFREHGAQLWRGVTLKELFLYWGGDERGNDFAGPREDFPNCVPVGSHAPHAVGVALAFRLRGEKRAAVCVFGDGATSKGDVAEALNMAGVWKVPAVFVVNNNGWAISVPLREADRRRDAGAEGDRRRHSRRAGRRQRCHRRSCGRWSARWRARAQGHGPTLIEARDLSPVRSHHRRRRQPLPRRRRGQPPLAGRADRAAAQLSRRAPGIWDKDKEEALLQECSQRGRSAAADDYLATPPQPPAAMFDYIYAELPADLAEQREAAAAQSAGAA